MYFPVLKWKLGEKKALEHLAPDVIKLITPIIEIQPCSSLSDVGTMSDKFGEEIHKAWTSNNPFYLDVSNIDEYCEDNIRFDHTHPLIAFIDKAKSKSKICIPAIPFVSMMDYAQVINSSKPYFKDGIAIRVRKSAFLDTETEIPEFVNRIGMTMDKIDLIIDVQQVTADDIPTLVISIKSVLSTFRKAFRRVALIGTGYPEDNPSSFMGNERYKKVVRTELSLWNLLNTKSNIVKEENIFYGDYCCANSLPMPEDVSMMRPSAIIKYTTEEYWHIWRGVSLIRGGHQQYFDLAKEVVESGIFLGPEYSWGDEQIYKCANRERTSGNPTTWVQIATNHHITLVAHQFASHSGF